MLLALLPLYTIFQLVPGTPGFFLLVLLAGALVNAGMPLLLVSAQDLAPHPIGTASGMLMGFSTGTAGLLYIGVGSLQEMFGVAAAMGLSYLALIPGALVAFTVLSKYRAALEQSGRVVPSIPSCGCAVMLAGPCACGAAGGEWCACPKAATPRENAATPA